ncbi:MAG: hypothetical protein K8I82_29640 [Anaerolineae bacterium]|nr:hypothetical protein [Anaerolineae bacterium]
MASPFQQFLDLIRQLLEEIWFNILSLTDNPEARLKRLRWLYKTDPKLTMSYRRAKEVIRDHLDKQYYDYYERFLSAERLAQQQLPALHQGARGDELFQNMLTMSEKIVNLIEQLQQLDKSMVLYKANGQEGQQIEETRSALRTRIEAALNAQAKIPIKMLTLTTTADSGVFNRLNESIDRLTNRLDDIATSYDDVRKYGDLDDAIRNLEDSQ